MKKPNSRKRTSRLTLLGGCALALIAAAGLVDGRITNRWAPNDDLQRASEALNNVPQTIGDWIGEDHEIDARTIRVAAATGTLKRTYQNKFTGEWIDVTVLCGPHGPISLHPPTVCFTSAGWELDASPDVVDYVRGDDAACRFWQASFAKENRFATETIVTDWGWNNGGEWNASPNPRFEYAGSPFLYKIYFTSSAAFASDEKRGVRDQFVRRFLDEFDRTVLQAIKGSTS